MNDLNTLKQGWSSLWLPPEKLKLSEWAERHLYLSPEYSARSGLVKLYGWQREILDAFTDDRVSEVVCMTSTQMVKTLLIQASIAYLIVEAPGPCLLIQPKAEDCKTFSKERIAPMLRDCPRLRGLVTESGPGKDNTIQEKYFPSGSLSLVGSIAPSNVARRSIRYLFCDELNKYPASAGNEGSPIKLAQERLATFGTRAKTVLCCSPTVDGSQIEVAFENSDQRQAWVPCPVCHQIQVLNFEQVKWDNALPLEKRPATAYYQCAHCDAQWNDLQRWDACEKTQWIAQKPFAGKAGFTISHLYSPFKRLEALVSNFLAAKHSNDRNILQTFINTNLCQTWKEEGQTPDEEILFARRESYPHSEDAIIPARACFLTCGVDIQDDRLEYEVVGWGRGKESWSIEYGVVQAFAVNGQVLSSTAPEIWAELNRRVLQREWNHESGSTMPILLMAIDTGYKPKLVYDFCLKHTQPTYSASGGLRVGARRSVVAIKGTDDDLKIISGVSKEDAARKRQGVRIVGLGTHCIKQELFDSLRTIKPDPETPIPGSCHFPEYNKEYFAGLCGEQRLQRGAKVVWEKKNNVRNEPLDCRVYARGAATICGIDRFTEAHWKQLEVELGISNVQPAMAPVSIATTSVATPSTTPVQQRPPRRVVGRFF